VIPAHALILAAGLGTRLSPLTLVRAKPVVPVAGEPLVRRIAAWLSGHGVTNLTLNLHHLPETVAACLGDGADLGVTVRYSWEQPKVLGSAGGPRLALDIVGADTFWIVNGDTLTDVALAAMHEQHVRTGAQVTLALMRNTEPHRYGGVRLNAHGHVTSFVKKGADAVESFHFVGVQLAHRRVFESLRAGEEASTIGGIYDALIRSQPDAICGYVSDCRFQDIGTVDDYQRTTFDWIGYTGDTANSIGRNVDISSSAHVSRSILWDNVRVAEGASLTHCIVTDDVAVDAGQTYANEILWRDLDGHLQRTAITHHLS
jgi:NDP-sugar pyrophosphorylase family protein